MFDFKQIEEVANHFPVCAQQPDLEQLDGEVIGALRGERLLKPEVSLPLRLSFNENGAEFSAGSNILNHCFVNRFLMLQKEHKRGVH
jgi:hypothetical protein